MTDTVESAAPAEQDFPAPAPQSGSATHAWISIGTFDLPGFDGEMEVGYNGQWFAFGDKNQFFEATLDFDHKRDDGIVAEVKAYHHLPNLDTSKIWSHDQVQAIMEKGAEIIMNIAVQYAEMMVHPTAACTEECTHDHAHVNESSDADHDD